MSNENVSFKVDDHIAFITIDAPKTLNALSTNILNRLKKLTEMLEARDDVYVVVLQSAGKRAFVSGADISEMIGKSTKEATEFARLGHQVMDMIANLPQPVVASIGGYALGAGLELALAADIRIASSKAVFGTPEVSLGIMPGFGGTQRLSRLVGVAKAKEFIFTGNQIKADEAQRIGLVNRVVEHSSLEDAVLTFVQRITQNSQSGVQMAKQTIDAGLSTSLEQGLAYEIANFGLLFDTEDQSEGMDAFVNKRPATFKR